MYQLDFQKPIRIFFCGIGGISMSGLAEVLREKGFPVSGSDMKASPLTESLTAKGIRIFIGQKADNITADIDLFVYTAAIRPDHPEFAAATSLGLPMLTRAQLLGQMMKNYEMPIAVSGTHGKTTVTGMVSEILMSAELDPTVSIGGILRSIGGNIRIGSSEVFVTEACEYTNSFLSFYPKATLILNIEEDHLDFFRDIDDIRASFRRFAALTPEDGIVIIGNEIEKKDVVLSDVKCPVITFGTGEDADYRPVDVHTDDHGNRTFTLLSKDREGKVTSEEFSLMIPGFHNVLNACAAIALADCLKIDREVTRKALKAYRGTDRRFEYKGTLNGVTIIDDYAHHPSEIRATLSAAVDYPHRKLWVIFQPHTYSRTKAFMDDFAKALSASDAVILADIYAARETDNLGISSGDIADRIRDLGKESYYFPSFGEIEDFVQKNCSPGDLLITMGAGDVVNIADHLLNS